MNHIRAASLPIFFAIALCACGATGNDMHSRDAQQFTKDGDPIYRKNPHPTQAYRITMTIEDAPGPFGHISGTAFYDNDEPQRPHSHRTHCGRMQQIKRRRHPDPLPESQ